MRFVNDLPSLGNEEAESVGAWLWKTTDHAFTDKIETVEAEHLMHDYVHDYCNHFRSPSKTDIERSTIANLEKIQKHAKILGDYLDKIESIHTYSGNTFNSEVLSTVFKSSYKRDINGEWALDLETHFGITNLVREIHNVAKTSLRIRRAKRKKHRPKEQVLEQLIYPLIRNFTCFGLMSHHTVEASLPSKDNGGYAWIGSVLERLGSEEHKAPWEKPIDSRIWSNNHMNDVTKAVGVVFENRMLSRSFVEPRSSWSQNGWNSFIGLEILAEAFQLTTREEFSQSSPVADVYFENWSAWVQQDANLDEAPDYVDH